MAGKLLFTALLSAACLTVLECNCWGCGRRASNIRKLFSTNEPIWIYSTTGPTKLRCLVDVVDIMERMSVNFTRSCYNRGHKVSRSLQGIFDQRRKKHMDVKTSGPLFNFQEDLLFMSDDYSCAVVMTTTNVCGCRNKYREEILFFDKWFKCAVVKVMSISCLSGRTHKHDLRVWNSSILARPSAECMREYSKVERNGHVIYNSNCHHILDNRPLSRYRQLNET
nr:uncharacterized protein LOC126534043 isoform X1 [Dermacentor andersoni]